VHKRSLEGNRIFVIRDFLNPEECASFMARSEDAGYESATITTSAGFVMNKEIRDNSRLILDDALLADTLWQRARPFIPATIDEWQAIGFNDRFRFYRYDSGQKFAPHYDGYFRRGNGERSQLTFMVYLNADFRGGETRFYDENGQLHVTVHPEGGMALVFIHLKLHEGAPVAEGRKYVLRTDVMYALRAQAEETPSANLPAI
jgi:predicted 2-oxoglutarate/Fe(II)-dependent dioxygenase YbiX